MCQLCLRGEEHTLLDCTDLSEFDPSTRRLIEKMRERRVEVKKLQAMLGFD